MRNLVLLTAAIAIGFVGITNQADGGPKTKAAMKTCMKGGLCKKVATGEGSAEDKAALLAAELQGGLHGSALCRRCIGELRDDAP